MDGWARAGKLGWVSGWMGESDKGREAAAAWNQSM